MRGTRFVQTIGCLLKPVGANSVRPLQNQTNFCSKRGRTQCAPTKFERFVASVRRRIKNKGHQWYPMSYGMLELFAASGKRTIFLDVSRHHFASKDGIMALFCSRKIETNFLNGSRRYLASEDGKFALCKASLCAGSELGLEVLFCLCKIEPSFLVGLRRHFASKGENFPANSLRSFEPLRL